jgi:hypothetical protein
MLTQFREKRGEWELELETRMKAIMNEPKI